MRLARRLLVVSATVCGSVVLLSAVALADTAKSREPDLRPATPIEEALMEHACDTQRSLDAAAYEAHRNCLAGELAWLREDFGYNLARLSPSDRKKLDAGCGPRRPEQPDRHFDCLYTALRALHERRIAENPAPTPEPLVAEPAVEASVAGTGSPGAALQSGSKPRGRLAWIAALALGLIGAAAAAVFLTWRPKASPRACRVCGAPSEDSGDSCVACRRQAAEAVRQAAAARAERAQADAQERQRQQEREEEEAQDRARIAAEERVREEADARRREEEQRREEAERREERNRQITLDESVEEAFDPHRVLGVSAGSSRQEILVAYEQVRSRYDPALVEHLGDEVRQHFKAKAEAVERAFRALVSSVDAVVSEDQAPDIAVPRRQV